MVRRLQSERYTELANVSGRVLLATVIESERVSIESFFFTSCFAFCMQLAKYMENDSRQHMASGFQRRQVNNHPLRFSKINDTTQPRLRPPISTTCSPEVGQGGPPQHTTIPKTTHVFMMNKI